MSATTARVWVADAHGGRVAVFGADGRHRRDIPVPRPMVTSLCFGGDDLASRRFGNIPDSLSRRRIVLIDQRIDLASHIVDPRRGRDHLRVRFPNAVEKNAGFDLAEMFK